VEFSTGGADYWTASVAVRGTNSKWIRKEREYVIKMKFLVLDIPACVPGPNILLGGDVERNPGPSSSMPLTTISLETIHNMHGFQKQGVKDREKKAREEAPGLHPCIIHMDIDEQNKSMDRLFLTDDEGRAHDEDTLQALADLVVSPDCADRSFMLIMDRVEMKYHDPVQLGMLYKYEPLAQHILSCMRSVLGITLEESLNHMLMACVQQKLEQLHHQPARSALAPAPPIQVSANQHMADVIRLSLVAGARQGLNLEHVTPEGLKAALIGPDQQGLGGNQFRQAFMQQLF
jgi:hypothetical protein